jgi:hypothetical protein
VKLFPTVRFHFPLIEPDVASSARDGGLPLLLLSKPSLRSNSATRAFKAAISALAPGSAQSALPVSAQTANRHS